MFFLSANYPVDTITCIEHVEGWVELLLVYKWVTDTCYECYVTCIKTKPLIDLTFETFHHRLWGDCHQGHAATGRPLVGVDRHSTEGSHLVHKLAQRYDGEIKATEQKHRSWEVRCKPDIHIS